MDKVANVEVAEVTYMAKTASSFFGNQQSFLAKAARIEQLRCATARGGIV